MTKKPTPAADRDQYQRFLETAKKVGADESPGSFDRAFKKIVTAKPPAPKKQG